jgi:hypothetical protein
LGLGRAGLLTAVIGLAAACQLLSGQPAITCGDLDPTECRRRADAIIADARRDTPEKRIVSIRFSGPSGVDVRFEDGTGWAVVP